MVDDLCRFDLILICGGAVAVQDDGLHGSPSEGRVQLRPVPAKRLSGEEGAQSPRFQEDRDYHRRPRLPGAARVHLFLLFVILGLVACLLLVRVTCVCELDRHCRFFMLVGLETNFSAQLIFRKICLTCQC